MSDLPKATAQGGNRKHRRRIGNYLLDKRLQLRYVAFVTILSALISGILGYLVFNQEARATDAVLAEAAEALADDPLMQEQIREELEGDDAGIIKTMVGVGIGLVIVLSLFLVIMTHKVAGPLYKVSLYFDKMAVGRLGDVWPLRRFDMLKDFYTQFSDMHNAVRDREVADNDLAARFLAACESAGVSREGELGHALDEFETYKNKRKEQLA